MSTLLSFPENSLHPYSVKTEIHMTPPDMITNFLTIDVEDYFQVHALSGTIDPRQWDSCECRVERNTHGILDLIDSVSHTKAGNSAGIRATFFVLGWIADRYPELVREISRRGHEIASHGYYHQLIGDQGPVKFRDDVRDSKRILEDITGQEVIGYRAPTYSLNNQTLWALPILVKEGYRYDSSVFPIRHDYYGMPTAPRFPFVWEMKCGGLTAMHDHTCGKCSENIDHRDMLFEFPLSTVRILGAILPCSGGGYFRLLPYSCTRLGFKRINRQGRSFVFYLHPWEVDSGIPVVRELSFLSRFRTYANLSKTKAKFRRLLAEFSFSTLKDAYEKLGWDDCHPRT